MITRPRQIEIENAVVGLLKDFGITQYPMGINVIAEALGIQMVPYSSLSFAERQLAFASSDDAFTMRTNDFTSAQVLFFFFYGAYYYRSRFSCAHEVGHIYLEHTEGLLNCESEANYFAGYLLAPHPLVLRRKPGQSIKDLFGISGDCAQVAFEQAQRREREGGCWRPHEYWLIKNVEWKGGGAYGRI